MLDEEAAREVTGDHRKAIPYGIYDPTSNEGWFSVGVDHDTAEFAVCHFPPGMSKWNKMERRMFCHMGQN